MSYSYINSNKTNSGTKNEKNKIIKQFESNIKKCFQNLKIAPEFNKPSYKNIKNKKLSKSTKISNKKILNSLFGSDLLPIPKQKGRQKSSNQKSNSNQNKKENSYKNLNKKNISILKLDLMFSSQKSHYTTSIKSSQSMKVKKKKIINLKSNCLENTKTNKEKNTSMNNKNFFSKIISEPFIKRINKYENNKRINISKFRAKFLKKELSECLKHTKISKSSLHLIEKKYDKNNLYQPFYTKEKNIEKNSKNFFKKTLRENNSYSFGKTQINYSTEKFNEFYEDQINWKKCVEQKRKKEKKDIQHKEEKNINKINLIPSLNKKSLKKINKNLKNEENSLKNKSDKYSGFIKNQNKSKPKEDIDKYKIKLKYILNDFYNNSPNFCLNKRKSLKKIAQKQINITTQYNSYKKFISNKSKSKSKNKKRKKLNNIKTKKQKKEKIKNNIDNDFDSINKYTYILKKKQNIRKKRVKN